MLESILKVVYHSCSSFLNLSQSFCFSLECGHLVNVLSMHAGGKIMFFLLLHISLISYQEE